MFRNLIKNKIYIFSSSCLVGSSLLYYNFNKKKYYSLEELEKHDNEHDAWVEHNGKIYDITNFIDKHPGGKEKILMAVGGSITPYWDIYKQHYNHNITNILKKYEIGYLKNYNPESKIDYNDYNPYSEEPKRETENKVYQIKPFNSESLPNKLIDNYITPIKYWFIRNHHPVPKLNKDTHKILIYGKNLKNIELDYNILKNNYKKNEIISTIQCAGNRRKDFSKIDTTLGIPWSIGAISNAKWGGVWLSEILQKNGYDKNNYNGNEHIHFIGEDAPFGTSVSLKHFLNNDVDFMLAYEMNDKELTRDLGYPVRLIAPGYTGSKNVKWIKYIIINDEEIDTTWQKGIAYKILPSNIKSVEDITPEITNSLETIEFLPIQSIICYPENNKNIKLSSNKLNIRGLAISSKGTNIKKVEISLDNGKTWQIANLEKGNEQKLNKAWAWTFWSLNIDVQKGKNILMVRATDINNNKQYDNLESIWNLRGIVNNSIHKIVFNVI